MALAILDATKAASLPSMLPKSQLNSITNTLGQRRTKNYKVVQIFPSLPQVHTHTHKRILLLNSSSSTERLKPPAFLLAPGHTNASRCFLQSSMCCGSSVLRAVGERRASFAVAWALLSCQLPTHILQHGLVNLSRHHCQLNHLVELILVPIVTEDPHHTDRTGFVQMAPESFALDSKHERKCSVPRCNQ